MNPQMLQSIMQMLGGTQFSGGLGSSGSFTSDPNSDLASQLQVGQPLDFNQQQMGGMQGGGMGGGFGTVPQMNQSGGGLSGLLGFRNSLGQNAMSGMNANRSGKGWSSFIGNDPSSIMQNTMMGQ